MAKSYQFIIWEKKGPIGHLTLNRPEKMNALSTWPGGLMEEWMDACMDAKNDSAIKVVIIKGNGRCFSAGYDISTPPSQRAPATIESTYDNLTFHVDRYFQYLWENPKVFIAQVHGFCLAGGNDMAGFSDLTIASEDAVFGYPIVRDGDVTTSQIWPYLIGMKKARELMYTGNMLTAEEAHARGLINRVVPRDQLETVVNNYANTIALVPSRSVKWMKHSVNYMFYLMGIRNAIEHHKELKVMASMSGNLYPLPEQEEYRKLLEQKGLKAALEWRDAKFAQFGMDAGKELRARKY